MSKYDPCEKFHRYQRLEGRPRQTELDDALAAKIHDPLWMMARQYQFGEFQGEDAGSAIFAKAAISEARLSAIRKNQGVFRQADPTVPLETTAERLYPDIDHKMSLRMGKQFLRFLETHGSAYENWPSESYRNDFINAFPFAVPDLDAKKAPGEVAYAARTRASGDALLFLKAIAGKAVNGKALWDYLKEQPERTSQLVLRTHGGSTLPGGTLSARVPGTIRFVDPAHADPLREAASQWIQWVKESWNFPADEHQTSWVDERLEYDFDLAIDENNNLLSELHANGYHHGHLDWFAFDAGPGKRLRQPGEPGSIMPVSRKVKTMIPTEAAFQGMPNARWWELEDGRVDPGNISATDTDVVAVLLAQFALYYSNDWLMIPLDIPMGTLTNIEGLVVTDTFGQKTWVEAAHKHDQQSWMSWTMYSLSGLPDENLGRHPLEQRLFLTPAAAKVIEGDPVEEIRFIRDEMANMVWAIEKTVPNLLGSGADGYELAANVENLYRKLEEALSDSNPDMVLPDTMDTDNTKAVSQTKPPLKYTLGNTVTENWIPFIPVHKEGSFREIELQRASMPRITEIFPPHQVRPASNLLRKGINSADIQEEPFYLFEEEVPRAGATVTGNYQRTRWLNGKVVTWFGRTKTNGRGEGSSGLRFDFITENK